ncbi:MAG: S8 family serine peptidase, partial [Phycisphaerales bacterium]|nr:S8 family serine peptidase [Phycisphaerales bacterium]
AGATGDNGVGISGICWRLNIMSVKVTSGSSGYAYISDILHGCNWAIRHGADVVNVSFAGVECDAVQAMGAYAHMEGAHLVWAAGNGAMNLDWFDHEDGLVVSATNETDTMYASSNFGRAIDVAAPGVRVPTLKRNGSYYVRTGTSYAAPHVSGVLALMRSVRPDLSPETIEDILLRTCGDLFTPGEDDFSGRGLLNARRAVLLAVTYGGNSVGGGGGDDDHDADINDDGVVDVNDVIAFLDYFWLQDPIADFDDNGIWDVMDLILFMNRWDEEYDG